MIDNEKTGNANTIKDGDTFKIYIGFDIDVPQTQWDSVFNSIVLTLSDIRQLHKKEYSSDVDIKILNDNLERIKQYAELLKIKEVF